MPNQTRELDRLIAEALPPGDAEVLDRFGEQSSFELMMEALKGRNRAMAGGVWVVNFVLVLVGIWALIQALNAADQRPMVLWSLLVGYCVITIVATKVWYWIEMSRLATAREIKRLELQVALLARRFEKGEQS